MRKTLAMAIAISLLSAAEVSAQARVGGELGYASGSDLGIGARLLVNLKAPDRLAVIGTFDWFFPDAPPGEDRTYWELNGNLAYSFRIEGATSLSPYAGGGLNIAHSSRELDGGGAGASDTDLGLNLLGGTLFGSGPVHPFVELRATLAGGEQFILMGGVLF